MVQTERLKQEIEMQGYSNAQVAWHLGISEQCFARKLQTGRFGTQDVQLLAELLKPTCPEELFFT